MSRTLGQIRIASRERTGVACVRCPWRGTRSTVWGRRGLPQKPCPHCGGAVRYVEPKR